jgi:3-oxoacyl-[acyl-carrier protein] reductase
MIRQRYGKIVNISSQVAVVGGEKSVFYSGTKAFVIAMAKSLALEVGQYGINVNAVAPGGIPTDMNRDLYPDAEAQARRGAQLPIGHMGVPEDVANCVLFLCSEEAKYLTGQTLHPSGGFVMQ